MVLAICMNDIPLSGIQYEIKINDSRSLAFYSMNIEAFEVFLKIISSDYDFSFSQILRGYNKKKEKAIENHQKAIFLNVNKYNKARFFYEKLGFTIVKDEVIEIGNGYVMDDFVMEVAI